MTTHLEAQAKALTAAIWECVVYNKGSIYELVLAALQAQAQRIIELEAFIARENE